MQLLYVRIEDLVSGHYELNLDFILTSLYWSLIGPVTMGCKHCGTDTGTATYSLPCLPESGESTEITYPFCRSCLEELVADPSMELVEPVISVAGSGLNLRNYR